MADGAPDISVSTRGLRAIVRNEGDEQFVVFPDGFHIDADEVSLRREGDTFVLEPLARAKRPQTDAEWSKFWAEIDSIRGDDLLALPEREPLDDSDLSP